MAGRRADKWNASDAWESAWFEFLGRALLGDSPGIHAQPRVLTPPGYHAVVIDLRRLTDSPGQCCCNDLQLSQEGLWLSNMWTESLWPH